jgi:hypothetical protein
MDRNALNLGPSAWLRKCRQHDVYAIRRLRDGGDF